MPVGGMILRIGASTGSVIAYKKLYTDDIAELGEIGNQERTILAKMMMR